VRPRLRLTLAILACAAAIALAAIVLAAPDAVEHRDVGLVGSLRPPGVPPFDFTLRDQDGRPARLAEHRGEVVLLSFAYADCREGCPLQAQQIRGALDLLDRDVPAFAVSVDPEGDTPRRARRFLREPGLAGRMRFLLGSRATLAPVWRHYGVRPRGAGFRHSSSVIVIDRWGRQRVSFPLGQLTPEGLAHDVRLLQR